MSGPERNARLNADENAQAVDAAAAAVDGVARVYSALPAVVGAALSATRISPVRSRR